MCHNWLFPSRHCEKLEGVNLNEVWNTELRLTTSNFEQGVKEWPLLHFWKCEVIRFEGSIYSHQWSNFAQNEVKSIFHVVIYFWKRLTHTYMRAGACTTFCITLLFKSYRDNLNRYVNIPWIILCFYFWKFKIGDSDINSSTFDLLLKFVWIYPQVRKSCWKHHLCSDYSDLW